MAGLTLENLIGALITVAASAAVFWIVPLVAGVVLGHFAARRNFRAAAIAGTVLVLSAGAHAERAIVRHGIDRMCESEGGFKLSGAPVPARSVLLDDVQFRLECHVCERLFAEGYDFIEIRRFAMPADPPKRITLSSRDDNCWKDYTGRIVEYAFSPGRCLKVETVASVRAETMVRPVTNSRSTWFGRISVTGYDFVALTGEMQVRATFRHFETWPLASNLLGPWDQFYRLMRCRDAGQKVYAVDAADIIQVFPAKKP